MDKVLFTGAVATTGGCSIVQGRSIQEMVMYVIIMLVACLAWQIGYAMWNCRATRKRIERLSKRGSANGC